MGLVWPFGFPFSFFNHKTLYPWGTLPQVRNIHTTLVFGGHSSLYWLFFLCFFQKENSRNSNNYQPGDKGGRRSKKRGSGFEGIGRVRRYNRKPRGIPYCFFLAQRIIHKLGGSVVCPIHVPFALLSHPRTGEEKQKRITATAWLVSSFSSVSLLAVILMRTCRWSCL